MSQRELEFQILETWRAHNRIMLHVIEHIPDDAMNATLSTRGGRGIGGQLAHVHMTRWWKLESLNRKLIKDVMKFNKETNNPNKAILLEAFVQSGDAVEKHLLELILGERNAASFKRQPVPTLGYFISHEAHHRGYIILTMKQSGFKLPEELKFGIWDWNKFVEPIE